MSIATDLRPSETTLPEDIELDEAPSERGGRKQAKRMGPGELADKLLPHLRLKTSMNEAQICIALGIPRCSRGRSRSSLASPSWLKSALNKLVARGEIEFSELYESYRLPGHCKARPSSGQGQQVVTRRDPSLATWTPHHWEQQKAERRARQEREQQILEAERKAERKAMRRELAAKAEQEQPAVQVEAKPKPKASPGRPKVVKPSNPAPFLGEKARKQLEGKIRSLVRSERHLSEDKLKTVLGKTAVEVARVMPDISQLQFGDRAFLCLKEVAA